MDFSDEDTPKLTCAGAKTGYRCVRLLHVQNAVCSSEILSVTQKKPMVILVCLIIIMSTNNVVV